MFLVLLKCCVHVMHLFLFTENTPVRVLPAEGSPHVPLPARALPVGRCLPGTLLQVRVAFQQSAAVIRVIPLSHHWHGNNGRTVNRRTDPDDRDTEPESPPRLRQLELCAVTNTRREQLIGAQPIGQQMHEHVVQLLRSRPLRGVR